jgi:hypothetical protein
LLDEDRAEARQRDCPFFHRAQHLLPSVLPAKLAGCRREHCDMNRPLRAAQPQAVLTAGHAYLRLIEHSTVVFFVKQNHPECFFVGSPSQP